ncbi:hypothetical protein GLOIN_2v1176464 [Rhizophagus clarus]|uniref:Uncharacterized protein n=1 Tax=Rhizophagus clarus TaxID=94130 RepID=A0A8H3M4N6_9GLOM|nr:hypothetical protein GLOIN_2v1176464 [Rhizophagus clarus]
MSKFDKILTPKYLDWHAKLTGLPRVLTDKICSNLYKKYKRETGLELWKLPEAHLLINSKPENKVSSFPEQSVELTMPYLGWKTWELWITWQMVLHEYREKSLHLTPDIVSNILYLILIETRMRNQ